LSNYGERFMKKDLQAIREVLSGHALSAFDAWYKCLGSGKRGNAIIGLSVCELKTHGMK